MSIGYPDFNTRSLIEQYNVVNRVYTEYTLDNITQINTYLKEEEKGLLTNILFYIMPSSNQVNITIQLIIDGKIIDINIVSFTRSDFIVFGKENYLINTYKNYKTNTTLIELRQPVMFFSSFSVVTELILTPYSTDFICVYNYSTASPTMIYQPV